MDWGQKGSGTNPADQHESSYNRHGNSRRRYSSVSMSSLPKIVEGKLHSNHSVEFEAASLDLGSPDDLAL